MFYESVSFSLTCSVQAYNFVTEYLFPDSSFIAMDCFIYLRVYS
jgi:hypothetical protein